MKIIIESSEKINKKMEEDIKVCIKNSKDLFLETYAKYMEKSEEEKALDIIEKRFYFVAINQGIKTVNGKKIEIQKNSYEIKDYKFIDTRVYHLDKMTCIINLSNINDIKDSLESIKCSIIHDVLHTIV